MTELSIFAAARDSPEAIGLIIGDTRITYAELAALAMSRAAALGQRRVPVLLQPQLDLDGLLWLYAASATGVPFLVLPANSTSQERAAAQALTGAEAPPQPGSGAASPVMERAFAPDQAYALLLSSGSTGKPKVIILSRRAVLASATASEGNLGLADEERWLLCLPVSHVAGLSIVVRMLRARRTVVLLAPAAAGLMSRMNDLGRQIHAQQVTLVSLVPTLLQQLLRDGFRPPRSLRAVLLGGAGCSLGLAAQARRCGIALLTSYGLTESGSQIAARRYAERHALLPARGEIVSSGQPLAGVELKIVNGRIAIKTSALFSGYLGADAPPLDIDGWFLTNDRGVLGSDGELYVLGRTDLIIITGGENVDPEEVERALRALPGVQDACVFGVPSLEFGQRVVAAVVPATGAHSVTLAGVRRQLRRQLSRFKLPRSVVIVDQLLFTASGKLDRPACADRFGRF